MLSISKIYSVFIRPIIYIFPKFHENQPVTFLVILLPNYTDREKVRQTEVKTEPFFAKSEL